MTFALLSCAKVQSPEPSPESPAENQEQSGKIEMEFSAISEAGTKTALGELSEGLRPITWVKDDEIKIYFNESFTTSKALSDGATTTFKANVDEAPAYYAVYPSSVESSLTDGSVSVTIPAKPVASKDFGSIHYAAAIAKDGNLSFKNLCGFIRFEIRNPEIRSLIIRGAGDQLLAGKVSVSFDENGNIGTPSISGGNSRIIATVAEAGVYYIPVLPGINLANGVGFRFYKEGDVASANAIETGVFSLTPLSVSRSGIVDLGCIDERIVTDWYIAPTAQGTGDGLSAENAAAGVTFLRRLLAQDDTNDKTKDGLAKGYGCIGVKVHAAAGEYDFGGEEIVVAWPGHTSAVGTTIEGAPGTLFKNSGNSRFFKLGAKAALTFNNLRFTGGKADMGGALYLGGDDATIKCDGCVFDGNLGSAVYLKNSSASAWFNSCVFTGNNSTPNSSSQYIGRAVLTAAGAATFFNNCTFGEQVASEKCFGDVDIRSGKLIFANSTMIGSASGGILRVHTGGGNALYLNSLVINKNGAKTAINYNSANGTFISRYVISGPPQNKYKTYIEGTPSDIDIANVKYVDIGSPAFDETDLVYKWDGKLTGYDKRISATDAAELIKTSSPEFHSWLNSINALDKDQLGNPRSPNNRQGSWRGN